MVAGFYESKNIDAACDKLVREAVKNWKRDDEVVDDITVVLLFFQDHKLE